MRTRLFQSGMSLVEVTVGVSLIGISLAGVIGYGKFLGRQQQQSNVGFQMDMIRRNLSTMLQNQTAWSRTKADPLNTSLACLQNQTDCRGRSGPFRVMTPQGAPLLGYDPLSSPSAGFSSSGQPCQNFNAAPGAGSDSCPYRMEVAWQPVCPSSGACLNPIVQITGTWTYNPATPERRLAFNSSNYNLQLQLGNVGSSSYVMAKAQGGQTLAYGAYLPVQFANIVSDSRGEFDGTYFRPQEPGVYLASFNTSLGPMNWNGGGCLSSLVVTDAGGASLGAYGLSASYPTNGPTNLCTGTGSHTLMLAAGERIWIQIIQTAGAAVTPTSASVAGGGYSTLTITRLR